MRLFRDTCQIFDEYEEHRVWVRVGEMRPE